MFVSQDGQIFLSIYMNNLLPFGSDNSRLIDIQDILNVRFRMTNMEEISLYLGMEVDIDIEKKISLR